MDTREAKRAAERCVENLSGVDDVQNELKVTKNGASMNRNQNLNQDTNNQARLS